MSDNYEDMTVAELKVILKERGLPVSGKKSDLIERLSQSPEEDLDPVEESAEEVIEESVEESSDDDFEEDDNWDDEDWDEDEDEGHVAKQKPVLSEEMKAALELRSQQKKKTPSFRRTEWFRYKRLSRSGWRAPHGMDSKQRRNYKYRSSVSYTHLTLPTKA